MNNEHYNFQISGLSSLNWTNVLSSQLGKRVLNCGKINNQLESLVKLYGGSVEYLSQATSFGILNSVPNCSSLQSIARNSYDVCLISDNEFFCEPQSLTKLRERLHRIRNLLKDNGVLLLGLPNGMHGVKFKLLIKHLLGKARFNYTETFFCVPSYDEPIVIYPFSRDRKYTFNLVFANYLSRKSYDNIRVISLAKNLLKCALARAVPMLSPFVGILIVAWKSVKENEEISVEKLLCANTQKRLSSKKEIYTVWLAKPLAEKQIGMLHCGLKRDRKLFAVCKQVFIQCHRSDVIRAEHETLTLLSAYRDEFRRKKIQIPAPIYFGVDKWKYMSIESAVHGIPLENYKTGLSDKRLISDYRTTLNELVGIQIYIQDFLSRKIRKKLPQISRKYFENTLNLSYPILDNIQRVDSYLKYVQHGDFTDVNIIFDDRGKSWGIIDWEWTSAGLPFLFDLFHLFTSLEFRENNRSKDPLFIHYFNSVVETFFRRNWFSNYVENALIRYCNHFSLNIRMIFSYFLDFLLFHHNKYNMHYYEVRFAKLFKELIHFAIHNKDSFLVYPGDP